MGRALNAMRWGRRILAGLCLAVVALPAPADDTDDLALPMDNPAALQVGKDRLGALCSGFCHGGGGKGGRAPCLVCGKFKRGGRNSDLVRNIEDGVPGTPMGAFKEKLNREEVLGVVAYLRTLQKEKEKEAAAQ